MKIGETIKHFTSCFLCLTFFAFNNGCIESPTPTFISSTTPSNEQLSNSNFVRLTNDLKSLPVKQRKNFIQKFLNEKPRSPIIEDSSLACFYWYGKATSVLVNGDIQSGWAVPDTMQMIQCEEGNFFFIIYTLPADARIDYQLIIDGNVVTDPNNSVTTPSGYGPHSQLAMPLFKPDSTREFRVSVPHGTIDSFFFKSKTTTIQPRMIKIYKPFAYENLSDLPVLYINDGFEAIEFCSYLNILDNLIADKKIHPILVVFIQFKEGDQDFYINKVNEYSTAICDELLPLIDKKYKSAQSPVKRVISGISAGAHAALLTALIRPDKFFNAAGQSTTITNELLDALDNATDGKNLKAFRFYFDVGRFDLLSGAVDNQTFLYLNQNLDRKMKQLGINHTFAVFNDGHQWANWRERIDELLIYFFGVDSKKQ